MYALTTFITLPSTRVMGPYCHEFWRSIPKLCWATYKMNSNEPMYCAFHKGQLAVGPSPLLSFVTPHRWSFNPLNHPSCWCLRKGSLRHERWVVNGNTWVVSRNMWAMMPNLVNGHGLRYIFLNWHLHFWKFSIMKYSYFDSTRVKGAYYHEYF